MEAYWLRPRIPIATWLGVVLCLIGIALFTVAFTVGPRLLLSVIGGLLAIIGALFILVALGMRRRYEVVVTLDSEGYTIEGPHGEYSGSWIDVTDILVSRKTAKIALMHGHRRRTIIAHPARVMDDEFLKVRDSIRQHLEASIEAIS